MGVVKFVNQHRMAKKVPLAQFSSSSSLPNVETHIENVSIVWNRRRLILQYYSLLMNAGQNLHLIRTVIGCCKTWNMEY